MAKWDESQQLASQQVEVLPLEIVKTETGWKATTIFGDYIFLVRSRRLDFLSHDGDRLKVKFWHDLEDEAAQAAAQEHHRQLVLGLVKVGERVCRWEIRNDHDPFKIYIAGCNGEMYEKGEHTQPTIYCPACGGKIVEDK